MSEAIKAGDLVMCVRARRCGCGDSIGRIHTVKSIIIANLGGRCIACGADTFQPGVLLAEFENANFCETMRLKRIDPPALPESISTDDEVTA